MWCCSHAWALSAKHKGNKMTKNVGTNLINKWNANETIIAFQIVRVPSCAVTKVRNVRDNRAADSAVENKRIYG